MHIPHTSNLRRGTKRDVTGHSYCLQKISIKIKLRHTHTIFDILFIIILRNGNHILIDIYTCNMTVMYTNIFSSVENFPNDDI